MLLEKIKKWLNRKFYISLRDAKDYEEKDSRTVSNLDIINICIVFALFSFAFGIFSSMLYFRRYIDPSYQEEKNKLLIRELYKDLDRLKRHDQKRSNFLRSLQGFLSDTDDIYAESEIKNFMSQYFCSPAENFKVSSNEDDLDFVVQLDVEQLVAIQDGILISALKKKSALKKDKKVLAITIQHDNGFVSVYEFSGKVNKEVGERVKMGEILGNIKTSFPLQISLFLAGQKINANKFFPRP